METLEVIGIIFLIAGFVLAAVEMYLPGFGAPGILGAVCFVVSVLLIAKTIEQGLLMAIIILCVLLLILLIMFLLVFKGRMKSSIILQDAVQGNAGYIDENDLKYLLGKEGIAATDLKPAGRGSFEGVEFEVYSESKYITKGKKIMISSIKNARLTVKEVS